MINTIALETTADRYIISVDKSVVSKETIDKLLDRIRLEYLIEKAAFSEAFDSLVLIA